MGNVHFTEIADFILGWLTLDISKDDWATRIADEERALNGLETGKPTEPAKEPPEGPPEEPPKAKPPEEPPPTPRPKEPPPKPGKHKHRLEDIIP